MTEILGTHLRVPVLNDSFLMNTNMREFSWFSNISFVGVWMKLASAFEGLSYVYLSFPPVRVFNVKHIYFSSLVLQRYSFGFLYFAEVSKETQQQILNQHNAIRLKYSVKNGDGKTVYPANMQKLVRTIYISFYSYR